jgi:nucleoside-diphosphate-sugar epimerase
LINIIISGGSGFVGSNWVAYSKKFEKYNNILLKRDEIISPLHSIGSKKSAFLHLAGKAHDTSKSLKPEAYYEVNTDLTKKLFDDFLISQLDIFIMISSVKAVSDISNVPLTEEFNPNPVTHYGKSKLLAEQYILGKEIPIGKRVYILRPCMIHGPGNKGNLNLLFKIVSKGLPWPLGSFENKRSFCNIENLCFIINELIENDQIPSGVYNVADDNSISTNKLISLIADCQSKKPHIWNIPKFLIYTIAKIGDVFRLPLNTERLQKLTENYIVSNKKIRDAINKPLSFSAEEGLLKTINSFHNNA